MPRANLDATDRRIIDLLQHDGRLSYLALSKLVGLSTAATRRRVQRLVRGQIVRIVAMTDPQALGYASQFMVGIRSTGDPRPIAAALGDLPQVHSVVVCAGGFDLLAEVVCVDDEHLFSMLNEKIRAIPGVTAAQAFIYLERTKQTFAWAVRQ